MAIVLYKPGNAHTIRGVRCEYKIFEGHLLQQLLEEGWFKSPKECYPKEEPKPEPKKIDVEAEEAKFDKLMAEETEAEDKKVKIIEKLKAKKAELLAKQDKE